MSVPQQSNMPKSKQPDFDALSLKYGLNKSYEWFGSISEWKVAEDLLRFLKVSIFDKAEFNALWSRHQKRNQRMVPILEPIREKLVGGGYDSFDTLPNDKDMGRWRRVEEDCGLRGPELARLMNITFPVQQEETETTRAIIDLQERQALLEKQMKARTSFVSNTQSRAEAMETMARSGDYAFSQSFNNSLESFRVQWWPKGGSREFPKENSGEIEECQPFVTTILDLFVSGNVEVETKKGGKKKKYVVKNIPNPMAFSKKSLGDKRPDAVFYDGSHKVGTSATAVTFVGEVRCGGVGEFSPEFIGQLTDGMSRLMAKQPFRKSMYGFLTDGRRFLYLRCLKEDCGITFAHSATFIGEFGWQILFGIMLSEPADLGHVDINVPGYSVDDLLGIGSYSVVMKATSVESIDIGSSATRLNASPNLPAEWITHRVAGEGNCLLHCLAHQLVLSDVLDENAKVYTHDLLRIQVLRHVDNDPRLRLMMSDEEYLELSELCGYVSHDAVAALALVLQVNITIFGGLNGEPVNISSEGCVGAIAPDRPTLRIVYNGVDGYDSVVPRPGTASHLPTANSASGRKRLRSEQSQPKETSAKRARLNDLPVAVKIFTQKYKPMRDLECAVLAKLRHNNNVPLLVQSLDVCDRPAVIVSPAGDKVLPLKYGVRANKTDFVKLLQVLKDAHEFGICHRDVKPENIFKAARGRIILNDWSSSAPTGASVPWAGTVFFYTRHSADHSPHPADDLVALVRSTYLMYTNANPIGEVGEDTHRIMNLSPLWRKALQFARAGEYNNLLTFLSHL